MRSFASSRSAASLSSQSPQLAPLPAFPAIDKLQDAYTGGDLLHDDDVRRAYLGG